MHYSNSTGLPSPSPRQQKEECLDFERECACACASEGKAEGGRHQWSKLGTEPDARTYYSSRERGRGGERARAKGRIESNVSLKVRAIQLRKGLEV